MGSLFTSVILAVAGGVAFVGGYISGIVVALWEGRK